MGATPCTRGGTFSRLLLVAGASPVWLPPGSWFKARTPASHAPADQPVAQTMASLWSSPSSVSRRATPLPHPGRVAVLSPSLAPQWHRPQPTAHSSLPATLGLVHSLNTCC